MKKINQKILGIFASICFLISIVPPVHSKEHRILVVPSGGALGKISVAFLVELERRTGKQVHELFTEYFGSSIGAQIISLLTVADPVSGKPKSAEEVDQFLDRAFQSLFSARMLRENFCQEMGLSVDCLVEHAKHPVRIIATKFIENKGKQLVTFGPETHGQLKLSEIACASCSVLPIMPPQTVQFENGESAPFIDPGCNFCESEIRRMHPLHEGFKSFTQSGNFEEGDTVTVFFIGNGWVNLAKADDVENIELKAHDDRSIPVKLFNIKVDISPILESWENENQFMLGGMIAMGALPKEQTAQNAAAAGLIPFSRFEEVTQRTITASTTFEKMVTYLMEQTGTDSTEVKPSSTEAAPFVDHEGIDDVD